MSSWWLNNCWFLCKSHWWTRSSCWLLNIKFKLTWFKGYIYCQYAFVQTVYMNKTGQNHFLFRGLQWSLQSKFKSSIYLNSLLWPMIFGGQNWYIYFVSNLFNKNLPVSVISQSKISLSTVMVTGLVVKALVSTSVQCIHLLHLVSHAPN